MTISIQNRQRTVAIQREWLRRFAEAALPRCAEQSADGQFALMRLPEVEVTLVSDRRIDRVHRDFMGIAGATDVITFEHGEIVISAETARARAPEFGHSVDEEIGLYLVHGLLHLNGFLDASARDAARMRKVQERIWRQCRRVVPLVQTVGGSRPG